MAMKKTIVAVSVLAVLGGAWVGASWYTGKLVETQLTERLADAQAQIKKHFPKADTSLTIAQYQRGVFSSQVTYAVDIVLSPSVKEQVTVNQNISHGPFPLAKFSLAPKLAYSQVALVNTESTKDLFKLSADKSPLTLDVLSSYDGSSAITFAIAPMEDKSEADAVNALKFSGITFNGTAVVAKDKNTFSFTMTPFELTESGTSLNINKFDFDGSLDNVTNIMNSKAVFGEFIVNTTNEESVKERYTAKDIELTGNVKTGKFDMNVGLGGIKLKSFTQEVNGQTQLSIGDVTMVSNVEEDDKNINQTLDTTVGNITMANKEMGSGRLMLKLNQFDGNTLRYINNNSEQISTLLLGSAIGGSPEMAMGNEQLMTHLMTFLDANPTVSISPFTWKNAKGESQLDMSLTLKRPDSLEFEEPGELAAQLIKQFSSSTRLSMPMLIEQAQINNQVFDGMDAEQAQAAAESMVQELKTIGTSMQTLTVQDDNLVGTFNYADGIIDLNGQKMPFAQFLNLLETGMSGE